MRDKLFGTDGLRGRVNEYPMTPDIALRLGMAVGQKFRNGSRRHKVIIGKDTRLSGYVFETALTSGL
ncbi:MAG: phosphoglucosamine mutase, partial [Desulfovibrio sp.]|nr:phosphoglucosamine mutase [Desulfovibrio sp.]